MIICHCTAATEKDILEAVDICKDFYDMQEFTGAGTGCESCLEYVMQIWEDNVSKQRSNRKEAPDTDQQRSHT